MAQKPDKFPDWATEEEIDEVSGQANFVEPPDIRKQSGWTRREIPPRQWFNWLARKTGLWFRWVEDRVEGLQYASAAESLAGEAEDRVIAPARFGDQSLTTNGYQVLPGGLIIQWGVVQNTSQTNESVAFPIGFNNAVLSVKTERSFDATGVDGVFNTVSWDYSLSGFTLRNTGSAVSDVYWTAIGY